MINAFKYTKQTPKYMQKHPIMQYFCLQNQSVSLKKKIPWTIALIKYNVIAAFPNTILSRIDKPNSFKKMEKFMETLGATVDLMYGYCPGENDKTN